MYYDMCDRLIGDTVLDIHIQLQLMCTVNFVTRIPCFICKLSEYCSIPSKNKIYTSNYSKNFAIK